MTPHEHSLETNLASGYQKSLLAPPQLYRHHQTEANPGRTCGKTYRKLRTKSFSTVIPSSRRAICYMLWLDMIHFHIFFKEMSEYFPRILPQNSRFSLKKSRYLLLLVPNYANQGHTNIFTQCKRWDYILTDKTNLLPGNQILSLLLHWLQKRKWSQNLQFNKVTSVSIKHLSSTLYGHCTWISSFACIYLVWQRTLS